MNILKKYTQKDRHGNMFSYEFAVPSLQEIPKPMAEETTNIEVKAMQQGVDPAGFKPKGTDTVPAMLTPGENIVNAEASRLPGVQPMLDELNDKGRAIQEQQGGPIPSYADSGGLVIDDALLDAVRTVETGDDPNQVSKAGAAGPYQITAATALNPGYGVTPISLEDRFDPVISRKFSKEYLQGIKKYHPTFNRSDILTSFHSGAGNVIKAKGGVEDLGPLGKAYPKKIDNAIKENNKSIFSYFNPVSSAYASTKSDDKDVPKLGYFDRLLNLPKDLWSSFNEAMKEGAYDENYLEKITLENLKTGQITLPDGKKVSGNILGSNNPITNSVDENVKYYEEQYKKNPNKRNKELLDNEKGKSKDLEKRINQINKSPANIVNNTNPKLKDIVNNIVTQTNNTKPVKEDTKTLAQEGKKFQEKNPDSYDKVKGFLSQFFDVGELARASLVYLGSRALGYEHGSSFNFVGKNYLKRIDAQMDANKKWANSKEATKNYEQASIQKFLITGDRNDLVKKGSSIVKPLKPMFNRLTQKVVQTVEMADGSVGVRIDGNLVPYAKVAGILDTLDPKIHDSTTIKKNFREASDQFITFVNKGIDENDQISKASISTIANQAESLLRNTMKTARFKKDTVARAEVISELEASIKDFYEAKRDYKSENRKTDPKSLKEFFDKRMVTFKTGGAWNPALVGDTGAGKLQEVQNNIFSMLNLNMDSKMSATQKAKVTKNFMNQLSSIWRKYSTMSDAELAEKGLRKNFIGTNTEGLNDFVNWSNEVAKGNPDAIKIIGALT